MEKGNTADQPSIAQHNGGTISTGIALGIASRGTLHVSHEQLFIFVQNQELALEVVGSVARFVGESVGECVSSQVVVQGSAGPQNKDERLRGTLPSEKVRQSAHWCKQKQGIKTHQQIVGAGVAEILELALSYLPNA